MVKNTIFGTTTDLESNYKLIHMPPGCYDLNSY